MKSLISCLLLTFALPLTVHADPSMLRVMCEGEDVGAEVSINGKFKGECPIDMQVSPGNLKLRVYKPVDASNERVYEQEIRIGDGVVKKVEAVLSPRLTAEGKKQAAAMKVNEEKAGVAAGFIFKGDVVQDTHTGLMWVRNGNVAGKPMTCGDAIKWLKTMDMGGYRDWRLPSKHELETLAKRGGKNAYEWFNTHGFNNVLLKWYWSYAGISTMNCGWANIMNEASTGSSFESETVTLDVWPVRDTPAKKAMAEKAGFIFKEDVVQDTLAGLMWARNASTLLGLFTYDVNVRVKKLNLGGYHDWRLPSKEELVAFVTRGGNRPSEWFNDIGFYNVKPRFYLSSSINRPPDRSHAGPSVWGVNMESGLVGVIESSGNGWAYGWPVRTGR